MITILIDIELDKHVLLIMNGLVVGETTNEHPQLMFYEEIRKIIWIQM